MDNYFDWQSKVKGHVPDDMRIGDDLIILENYDFKESAYVPRKVNVTTFILMDSGNSRTIVDGKEYCLQAPCMAAVLPHQTYCFLEASDDIKIRVVIMSQQFTLDLGSASFRKMIQDNPVIDISSDMVSFNTYYKVLLNAVRSPFKAFRLETAKHLTMSMIYYYAQRLENIEKDKKKKELVYERFCDDVREYYKINRSIPFYSGRLGVSSKYLTDIVKERTGMTANDYIDRQTIIECEALLSSTELSIQQISRKMSFPSCSVFGKFFKRVTGMSPTEYREKTQ
ncbi:MAG: AraC family transcriptional regulator [Bacteroidales bacterium]|nr:AraC family transcriptional regulator [Bacteroidales bacterium]